MNVASELIFTNGALGGLTRSHPQGERGRVLDSRGILSVAFKELPAQRIDPVNYSYWVRRIPLVYCLIPHFPNVPKGIAKSGIAFARVVMHVSINH